MSEEDDVIIVPKGFLGVVRKMKSIIKDNKGVEYFCLDTKDSFDLFPENRTVEIFEKDTLNSKKFRKEFLVYVKDISETPRKVVRIPSSK